MKHKFIIVFYIGVIVLILGTGIGYLYLQTQSLSSELAAKTKELEAVVSVKIDLENQLASVGAELDSLTNEDQYKINQDLKKEHQNIKTTYAKAISTYENLLKLQESSNKTSEFEKRFTKALTLLSNYNWSSASSDLAKLDQDIETEKNKISQTFTIPANVPINNAPPGSGYFRQQVSTEIGNYMVSLVAADLSSTRIIVDTASENSCSNDCPVLSLADYVSRNGAFAGINGSYFCPTSYPSCAGKTNSFDTLLMNKNKVYFNSDNNVYSTVPAAIFGSGWIRFVGKSLDWGRDTGIDSMIANQPLLVSDKNAVFGGDGDPKKGSKGGRSFVANKGNTVYIGVIHNATVAEASIVLKTMGMDNALNLDSGGSTALWSGGYKVGPGRNIPNAILFVKK
jgi:hypothetical protein